MPGETGLLIPVRSSKFLEDAMSNFASNIQLVNEMGLNARKRAVNHFSENSITLKILQLYKNMLNG